MSLVPIIDTVACSGHAECEAIAPQVFRVDDAAVVVIGSGPPHLVLAAAEACPTVAITVVDDATGEQVYP